jgi:hypothetical protein
MHSIRLHEIYCYRCFYLKRDCRCSAPNGGSARGD